MYNHWNPLNAPLQIPHSPDPQTDQEPYDVHVRVTDAECSRSAQGVAEHKAVQHARVEYLMRVNTLVKSTS